MKEVDECKNGSHQCGSAICKDTPSSYVCDCSPGFMLFTNLEGDKSCIDQNECTLGIHKCDKNTKCYNERGGYRRRFKMN